MWIMVSGPYSSGGADAAQRVQNLRLMNKAAVTLFRAGHVPIIGVNMALPMIEAAGGSELAYQELMMPVSLEQNPNNQSHWGFPWASKSASPCWLGTEASLHGENPV